MNLKRAAGISIKFIAPAIGTAIGGPIGSAFFWLAGAIIESIAGEVFEHLGNKLASTDSKIAIQDIKNVFAEPVEKGLCSAVNDLKNQLQDEFAALPINAKNWLNKKLNMLCKIDTWGKLSSFIPQKFNNFNEFYYEPIRKFLMIDKPETVPDELISKIANELARKSIDSVLNTIMSSEDEQIGIFNFIIEIYAQLFEKANMHEKWEQQIKPILESEKQKFMDWTVKQIQILNQNHNEEIEQIRFELDELKSIIKNIVRRLDNLENKVDMLMEGYSIFAPKLKISDWHNIPHYNKKLAVKRDSHLKKLYTLIETAKTVAIVGMPGIGKSFLVNSFIHENEKELKKRFPDGVLWIDVTDEPVNAAYLASRALLYLYSSLQGVSDSIPVFKSILSTYKMLVIFDGVDNISHSEISKLLFEPVNSRLIFTSKNRSVFESKVDEIIKVGVLQPEESIELFENILGKGVVESQKDDFMALANAIGNLPLAISILASRMKKQGWSAKTALTRFNKLKTKFLKTGHADSKETNIEVSFELSFNLLSERERDVMYAVAAFSEQGARIGLLAKVLGIAPDDDIELDELERSLEILDGLSLLNYYYSQDDRFSSMHNLIRDFVRLRAKVDGKLTTFLAKFVDVMHAEIRNWKDKLGHKWGGKYVPEQYKEAIQFTVKEVPNILDACLLAITEDEIADKLDYKTHIYATRDVMSLSNYPEKFLNMALELAILSSALLHAAGLFNEEILILNKACEFAEHILRQPHVNLATIYGELGNAYSQIAKYDKALEFMEKALKIDIHIYGTSSAFVANDYNNIGIVYSKLGNYDKAIEYYKKSLEINEINGIFENLAINYNNLADAFIHKNEYEKAIEHLEKALIIAQETLKQEHPYFAIIYNTYGNLYESKGDFYKALDYYKKALEIDSKVYDSEHPFLAKDCNFIGNAYVNLGKYDDAIEYLNKALKIRENRLGKCHPDTLKILETLYKVYLKKGDNERANEINSRLKIISSLCEK